jgi:hypothetical protein
LEEEKEARLLKGLPSILRRTRREVVGRGRKFKTDDEWVQKSGIGSRTTLWNRLRSGGGRIETYQALLEAAGKDWSEVEKEALREGTAVAGSFDTSLVPGIAVPFTLDGLLLRAGSYLPRISQSSIVHRNQSPSRLACVIRARTYEALKENLKAVVPDYMMPHPVGRAPIVYFSLSRARALQTAIRRFLVLDKWAMEIHGPRFGLVRWDAEPWSWEVQGLDGPGDHVRRQASTLESGLQRDEDEALEGLARDLNGRVVLYETGLGLDYTKRLVAALRARGKTVNTERVDEVTSIGAVLELSRKGHLKGPVLAVGHSTLWDLQKSIAPSHMRLLASDAGEKERELLRSGSETGDLFEPYRVLVTRKESLNSDQLAMAASWITRASAVIKSITDPMLDEDGSFVQDFMLKDAKLTGLWSNDDHAGIKEFLVNGLTMHFANDAHFVELTDAFEPADMSDNKWRELLQ